MTTQDQSARSRWRVGTAVAASALLSFFVMATRIPAAPPSPTRLPDLPPVLAAAPTESAAGLRIAIEGFKYQPATLTVAVSTTVMWVNQDDDVHTVTSVDGLFASPGLGRDEAFSRRFDAPGTYTYFCAVHPHMRATIIVK